ncbi:Pentatricopeptide repeat-containing protein, chloroplastic [Symbiodinium microadriaticum]|uniref:Pentatricopeptide repeat-containing protein, chloroplastic n=1 Tax=Symbiodinium microadriaticum TaxID=2951 RepID=A0A1Q9CWX2_SYMMI|nr:Pentatricopeptide repeat-containing protein, chloroplastic [Symbiodinium microadriaticum]
MEFAVVPERNTIVEYNKAISACRRCRDWQRALVLVTQIKALRLQADVVTYNSSISASEAVGRWQTALQFFHEMDRAALQPDVITFNSTISACEKGSAWMEALAIFVQINEVRLQPDTISFNATISAFEKAGKWQHALVVLASVHACHVQPDLITYDSTLSACEKGSAWQQAVAILACMSRADLERDIITYNCTISACKHDQWKLALLLLVECEIIALQPNVVTFSAAINACSRSSAWPQALTLLQNMQQVRVQPNPITYISAISACEGGAEWQWALFLLRQMSIAAVAATNAAISSCEKAGAWQHALLLSVKLWLNGLRPDVVTSNASISACGRAMKWKCSCEIFGSTTRPSLVTCNSTISACERAAEWRPALDLLGQVVQTRLSPDVITYSGVISACENDAQWLQALILLSLCASQLIQADEIAYNSAISACHSGEWQLTSSLLHDISAMRCEVDTITYNSSISACQQYAEWEQAVFLLYELCERRLESDVITYQSAVKACEVGAGWQQALFLLGDVETQRLQSLRHSARRFICPANWLSSAPDTAGGHSALIAVERPRGCRWVAWVATLLLCADPRLRPPPAEERRAIHCKRGGRNEEAEGSQPRHPSVLGEAKTFDEADNRAVEAAPPRRDRSGILFRVGQIVVNVADGTLSVVVGWDRKPNPKILALRRHSLPEESTSSPHCLLAALAGQLPQADVLRSDAMGLPGKISYVSQDQLRVYHGPRPDRLRAASSLGLTPTGSGGYMPLSWLAALYPLDVQLQPEGGPEAIADTPRAWRTDSQETLLDLLAVGLKLQSLYVFLRYVCSMFAVSLSTSELLRDGIRKHRDLWIGYRLCSRLAIWLSLLTVFGAAGGWCLGRMDLLRRERPRPNPKRLAFSSFRRRHSVSKSFEDEPSAQELVQNLQDAWTRRPAAWARLLTLDRTERSFDKSLEASGRSTLSSTWQTWHDSRISSSLSTRSSCGKLQLSDSLSTRPSSKRLHLRPLNEQVAPGWSLRYCELLGVGPPSSLRRLSRREAVIEMPHAPDKIQRDLDNSVFLASNPRSRDPRLQRFDSMSCPESRRTVRRKAVQADVMSCTRRYINLAFRYMQMRYSERIDYLKKLFDSKLNKGGQNARTEQYSISNEELKGLANKLGLPEQEARSSWLEVAGGTTSPFPTITSSRVHTPVLDGGEIVSSYLNEGRLVTLLQPPASPPFVSPPAMSMSGDLKLRRGEDWRSSGHNATIGASDVPTHHFQGDIVDLIRRAWAEGWGPIVFGHGGQAPRPPVSHCMRFEAAASIWNFNGAADAVQMLVRAIFLGLGLLRMLLRLNAWH